MSDTGKTDNEIPNMRSLETSEVSISNNVSKLNKDPGRIRTISNSRILIKPQCCPFVSCTSGKVSRHFKTAWSLLWHLSNSHKQEHNFKQEFERIRRLVSQ